MNEVLLNPNEWLRHNAEYTSKAQFFELHNTLATTMPNGHTAGEELLLLFMPEVARCLWNNHHDQPAVAPSDWHRTFEEVAFNLMRVLGIYPTQIAGVNDVTHNDFILKVFKAGGIHLGVGENDNANYHLLQWTEWADIDREPIVYRYDGGHYADYGDDAQTLLDIERDK